MDDDAVVAAQIGRATRGHGEVATRCHFGLPVVVRMPPLLDDGTPFPTRYWLTCPLAVKRIGRLEAAGGVREMEEWVAADPELAKAMTAAHEAYAADRDSDLPPGASPAPRGGVAGIRGEGIKCLHAHYAHHAAGGDNPVGRRVAAAAEPLNDHDPCVIEGDGGAVLNPAWREPG